MIRSLLRKGFNKLKSGKIIMLHHVQDQEPLYCPCVISTQKLSQFLDGQNRFISVADLTKSPKTYEGSVCITIDDSLYDLYTVAYPLLTRRNIPFTAFVSCDLLDKEGYITTPQLKEMAKHPLVTIGSHGATHRCLDELSREDQWYEIHHSKKLLEQLTGKPVLYYAYSNGRFQKQTKKLIKKAGYKLAFGVRPRVHNCLSALENWNLSRYNLTDKTVEKI